MVVLSANRNESQHQLKEKKIRQEDTTEAEEFVAIPEHFL